MQYTVIPHPVMTLSHIKYNIFMFKTAIILTTSASKHHDSPVCFYINVLYLHTLATFSITL